MANSFDISFKYLLGVSQKACLNELIVFSMLHQERERVMKDPGLRSVFVNPKTGNIWSEGDVYTFPSLGATLRRIAINGAKEFYEGETAVNLVKDIQVGCY